MSLFLGIVGFSMTFISLAHGAITGAIIGTNTTSRLLGFFGIVLMVVAVVIRKYEGKK